MKETFAICPPRTVQWREWYSIEADATRTLWRTDECSPDRWHYSYNPCSCAWPRSGTPLWHYRDILRYALELVAPETGTWRRDSQSVASIARNFREQIRQTREAEAVARAAIGPQSLAASAIYERYRANVEANRVAMEAKYGQRATLSGGRANFQNLPRPPGFADSRRCVCCPNDGATWPERDHWYRT